MTRGKQAAKMPLTSRQEQDACGAARSCSRTTPRSHSLALRHQRPVYLHDSSPPVLPHLWSRPRCRDARGAAPARIRRRRRRDFRPTGSSGSMRFLTEEIEAERYSGQCYCWRETGLVVEWRAFGLRDRESRLAMERTPLSGSIRCQSLTRRRDGARRDGSHPARRIRSKYLPGLAKMRVWKGGTDEKPVLVPAKGQSPSSTFSRTPPVSSTASTRRHRQALSKGDPCGAVNDPLSQPWPGCRWLFNLARNSATGFRHRSRRRRDRKVAGESLDASSATKNHRTRSAWSIPAMRPG